MRLFISYSRDDKAWSYEFWRALRDELNYDVWIDRKLVPASDWWGTICENIENCDCFLMVLSEKAAESIYCRAELDYAIALNKPVLPLMLKPCKFPDALNQRNTQYQDLTHNLLMDKILLRVTLGLNQVERDERNEKYKPQAAERPPVPHARAADDLTEVYVQAVDALESGNDSLAEMLFQQVIVADPDDLGELAQERIAEIQTFRRQKGAYQKITRFAGSSATRKDAQTLARKYVQTYGMDYDPEEVLAGLVADLTPEKPVSQPSLQQIREMEQNRVEVMSPKVESKPIPKLVPPDMSKLPPPFEWCEIPAGKVTLEAGGYLKERTTFEVERFSMAKYPITNAQYQVFVDAKDGYRDARWWDYSEAAKVWRQENPQPRETGFEGDDLPRTDVTWYEAVAFCLWLREVSRQKVMLPTEQQWQRAAQGDDGQSYPWGNDWDGSRCNNNVDTNGVDKTTPVRQYAGKGDSPFKVSDMSGNVWEWCLTGYESGGQSLNGIDVRVLRGGSWFDFDTFFFRCGFRYGINPNLRNYFWGFRVSLSSFSDS